MDCTIFVHAVAKTKALISFAVTTKLICVFDFAYSKRRFSHGDYTIVLLAIFANFLLALHCLLTMN